MKNTSYWGTLFFIVTCFILGMHYSVSKFYREQAQKNEAKVQQEERVVCTREDYMGTVCE